MPTLRQLEARFIAYREETKEEMFVRGVAVPAQMFMQVDTLQEAHGIRFICPKSFETHGGIIGSHYIQIYFAGSPVPDNLGINQNGTAVRWNVSGTSLDDLSITPSIQEEGYHCGWHGFVGSGGVDAGSAN